MELDSDSSNSAHIARMMKRATNEECNIPLGDPCWVGGPTPLGQKHEEDPHGAATTTPPIPAGLNHSNFAPDSKIYRLTCCDYVEPRLVNFYDPEEWQGTAFRWSEPVAMVRLDVPANNYNVTIETASLRGSQCDFRFELIWNDRPIPKDQIRIANGQIHFRVDRSLFVSSSEQRLTITCKPLNAEQGRRQLGMPIAWIELRTCHGRPGEIALCHVDRPPTSKSKKRFLPAVGWAKKTPLPVLPIWNVKMPTIPSPFPIVPTDEPAKSQANHSESVVVSSVEINSRHGTGLLIQYLFNDFSDLVTVASTRCYNGDRIRSAVHHDLPSGDHQRHDIFRYVLDWFGKAPPRRAYVVPFFETDMIIAVAMKDLFGTKICLHIMDDNCLFGDEISREVAMEAIEKSDLRLANSPEMRTAYEQRFGMKFWLLPPIVPESLIPAAPTLNEATAESRFSDQSSRWKFNFGHLWRRKTPEKKCDIRNRGILIGNIWDSNWLELLRRTVRESGLQVDWFSNNPEAVWLKDSISNLASDGIHLHHALWGIDLVAELRKRPFAVMPSGQLEEGDLRDSIARLSLPSRVPFVTATSQLPVIVLGSRDTAAARFVERFELGRVAPYNGADFRQAVEQVSDPAVQRRIRHRAHEIAQTFSATGMSHWLWQSLDQGVPSDHRFEEIFAPRPGEFAVFVDVPAPKQVDWDKREMWQMLRRLKDRGFNPQRIIDVGASNGVWSWTAATVFPDANYVLVDPLHSHYPEDQRNYFLGPLHEPELIEAAFGNQTGQTEILLSDDLYGSSLLKVKKSNCRDNLAKVDVVTMDDVAKHHCWTGSTLVKLDVQFAEHLVIEGGLEFIKSHVDALILELTLEREHPQAKTYREMLDLMHSLGYRLFDEMEGWRNPVDGRLEQKDALFVRAEQSVLSRAA